MEQRTEAGPIIYRVEVLWWPGKGWATHSTHISYRDASNSMNVLLDGLDSDEAQERVIRSWTSNGYHLPHLDQVEHGS